MRLQYTRKGAKAGDRDWSPHLFDDVEGLLVDVVSQVLHHKRPAPRVGHLKTGRGFDGFSYILYDRVNTQADRKLGKV